MLETRNNVVEGRLVICCVMGSAQLADGYRGWLDLLERRC